MYTQNVISVCFKQRLYLNLMNRRKIIIPIFYTLLYASSIQHRRVTLRDANTLKITTLVICMHCICLPATYKLRAEQDWAKASVLSRAYKYFIVFFATEAYSISTMPCIFLLLNDIFSSKTLNLTNSTVVFSLIIDLCFYVYNFLNNSNRTKSKFVRTGHLNKS